MKLICISVTDRCNFACTYCPMLNWRNGKEDNSNGHDVNIDNVCNFLDKFVSPTDVRIEITGGEPSLHPNLNDFLTWLHKKGYKGLIKTNGQNPIPKIKSFYRIAAFHQIQKPPQYYDEYLIIGWHSDCFAKIDYCKRNKIPYYVTGYEKNEKGEHIYNPVTHYAVMFPHKSGETRIAGCYQRRGYGEFDITKADYVPFTQACHFCDNILGYVAFDNRLINFRQMPQVTC